MLTEWIKIVCVAILVTFGTVRSKVCEDLDPQSCATLLEADPQLCQDAVLAHTACPRTCKICPGPTCFHCPGAVGDYDDCNTTKVCQIDENCLFAELFPEDPSQNHQYKMQCASKSTCSGVFQRRDVSTHCCAEDLCNDPTIHASTSPTTTTTPRMTTSRATSVTTRKPTTTPKTTTTRTTTTTLKPITSTQVSPCARDIIIMVEDSEDSSEEEPVKTFLKDLVDSIPIGLQDSFISFSLFDHDVYNIWDFYPEQTKLGLQFLIDDLEFRHSTDEVDLDDVSEEVASHFRHHRGKFRPDIPEAVLIISESYGGTFDHKRRNIKRDTADPIEGENIIVVNVGDHAIDDGSFTSQATDSDHVVDVDEYSDLQTQVSRIRDLICY